ncbi:FAD/NAD(P)-binding protein [Wenjunlia tyrosinilytica]|uniref:FAD-dependent urate hydroxylase HpyO/Asp monooxygenase CreE-like FAD/NAD(P)-binding domain-containing protein n=1 Tax=Wenjunlia tyrosinilytica TaxID=1544741 RepID=A0A917ZT87_9ACTN|nr:FAD/NAD(P)-binding protein [Wenjunlia tyrosinilytica]GGO90518.1 hypothetical protein GCM10012280_36220 [Wenjunlia tyrosinilytica]
MVTKAEPFCTVAVVGAGAAGTMTATRLLDEAVARQQPLSVLLVDPAQAVGRGSAYCTVDERHLLNIPAGCMSAEPDEPDDFLRWLEERSTVDGQPVRPGVFAQRRQFGEYLAERLWACAERARRASTVARLIRVRDRVVHAEPGPRGGLTLRLDSGMALEADAAVLALGSHAPGTDWAPVALKESPAFVADPWAPGALDRVPTDTAVLLVGTGLTMVDVALTLERPGRTVHAVSRRGLLPAVHAERPVTVAAPCLEPYKEPGGPGPAGSTGLDTLRTAVLRHVVRTVRARGDWRPALDSLRPLTAALWQRLPERDRARFLESDARVWEVHRHRMPAATAERLGAARAGGRVEVRAGQVAAAEEYGQALRVTFDDGTRLTVGAVVNCTGPQSDVRRVGDPLLDSLRESGLARVGPAGLGLDTGADGRVLSRVAPPLWTLGALRRGNLWETTAVPEIRAQAAEVAVAVLDALVTASPARRPKPTDRYGLRLTTTAEAAAAYNVALERVLRVGAGAQECFAEAVAADPGFALGHAALALLGHEWGSGVDVPRALAAAVRTAYHGTDARERSFVHAVAQRVTGTESEGAAALLNHIKEHPRDALAVSAAVPTISFGGVTCGEQTWALVEGLAGAYGGDWWYRSQLAFVRQDQGRWYQAESLAVLALAEEPASGHAVHARAHVDYETGHHADGLGFLDLWIKDYGPEAADRAHFSWHAALHELMLCRPDAVRTRYLSELAPPAVTGARALVDSGSLLWRCRTTDSWDGQLPAAPVIAAAPESWLHAPPTSFAALHAAVALAADEDLAGLARLRRYAERHTLEVFREVVVPLCSALALVVGSDWRRAVPTLRSLLPRLTALGGSAAQREIVEETLLYALTRSGRCAEAAALLDRRLDRRPSPLDRQRLTALA